MTELIKPNRRDFFKTIGLTAAATALPGALIPTGSAIAQSNSGDI